MAGTNDASGTREVKKEGISDTPSSSQRSSFDASKHSTPELASGSKKPELERAAQFQINFGEVASAAAFGDKKGENVDDIKSAGNADDEAPQSYGKPSPWSRQELSKSGHKPTEVERTQTEEKEDHERIRRITTHIDVAPLSEISIVKWADRTASLPFNTLKEVKKDSELRKLGKGLKESELKEAYKEVQEKINRLWGVVQSLSERTDGLTPTSRILGKYLRGQIETVKILEKMGRKKDNAPYKGALSQNIQRLQELSDGLAEATNPSNINLRQELSKVQSGELTKRREAAKKTIDDLWRKSPQSFPFKFLGAINYRWNKENTDELRRRIIGIHYDSESMRTLKNKNRFGFPRMNESEEVKEIQELLKLDILKVARFDETAAQRLIKDGPY